MRFGNVADEYQVCPIVRHFQPRVDLGIVEIIQLRLLKRPVDGQAFVQITVDLIR